MRTLKSLICALLALACLTAGLAAAETADLSYFRENPSIYEVTDLEGMTFVASKLSGGMTFPLPGWGENSYALAYFAIIADGEESVTPALLINVYTEQPWHIRSLTIPVEDQAFTFSWPDGAPDSVTEEGACQLISIILGEENLPFMRAMAARATSVTDPNLLLDMPVEIIFHGDEDCTAVMSEYTMMDYTAVVYAGYGVTLDGFYRFIGSLPGTSMTVGGVGEDTVFSAEAKPEEVSGEAPVEAETPPEESAEATGKTATLEDVVGVWELESMTYLGRTVTVEELGGALGSGITTEFTSDGMMILQGDGMTPQVYEVDLSDDTVSLGGNDAVRLENGKLILEVTDLPGMSMTLVRSDRPGREATAAVDDAMVGRWVFEQVVNTGSMGDIPMGPEIFQMVYGVPAPTLTVRKGGLAMMTLGDDTVTFHAEEWHLEDGKLVHAEHFDDGDVMTWYFVREGAAVPDSAELPAEDSAEAPAEDASSESCEAAAFSYKGAVWGMTKDEVRALMGEPLTESGAAAENQVMLYPKGTEELSCIVRYHFLPDNGLYSIDIMAPDADGAFFAEQRDAYTALYGEPMTEADADPEAEDPVAVMLSVLQASGDTDFLGWQADDETVIIMSRGQFDVCYIELRRYTDFFRFE